MVGDLGSRVKRRSRHRRAPFWLRDDRPRRMTGSAMSENGHLPYG